MTPHGRWHNDTIYTVKATPTKVDKKAMKNNAKENISKTDSKLISLLEQLPRDFWDFKDSDTREYTHGIHNYPAMMVCPISRNIIRIVKQIRTIDSLFDPFSGSGTVLVEGMLANIKTIYGNDINPLALFISKVKTKKINISELQNNITTLLKKIFSEYKEKQDFYEQADEYCQNIMKLDLTAKVNWGDNAPNYLKQYILDKNEDFEIPSFKNIGYWFKPRVILQLQMIKNHILQIEDENIRNFIFIAFSEAVRLVSNKRNSEFKMFRMPSQKVKEFAPYVIKDFTNILNRNVNKMQNFVEACSENNSLSEIIVFSDNAKELTNIPDSSIDLVITSPPYGDSRTTVAYGEYSRLSLQWLDLFFLSEKAIMGIDKTLMGGTKYRTGFEFTIPSKTLKKALDRIKDKDLKRAEDVYSFYLDLEKAIASIAKKTKENGYQFWVVGNRTVKEELLKTDLIIAEIAKHYKMEHIYTINRNIINKVMPSLNSPTNESGKKSVTMCNEHIVILRKTK